MIETTADWKGSAVRLVLLRNLRSGQVLVPLPIVDNGEVGGMPWRGPPQKCPHRSMNLEAGHGGDSIFTISEGHLREPSRIRSASCSVQSPICIVGRNMSKRNRTVFGEGNLEAMVRLRGTGREILSSATSSYTEGQRIPPYWREHGAVYAASCLELYAAGLKTSF